MRSVEGKLVSRFGLPGVYIGATRRGREIVWDTTEVHTISATEYQAHRKAYDSALRMRDLVRVADSPAPPAPPPVLEEGDRPRTQTETPGDGQKG